ncbi:hypothetical protein [Methylotuvimicrobium alcaliphilum]|uniref:Porin n=1 Tax=Methylotuvimicrobium alcaliphilum (strain DSM 19304 / NCIMB 14124 / VKM B-2133 / 20Z) TaxID=1091494 RepID=G4SZW2_META2|nr:hypothetical protein [Methylotuvimicrobium alcaliphilum]CCE25562.1 exported protein of unknown function [Methylotuvimicrobium alcaliphilum 20Z]
MKMPSSYRPFARVFPGALFGLFLSGVVAAAEPKDPERYMQELLAIEKRLDAKLQALDEKLKRLEQLEAAQPVAASKSEHGLPKKDDQTALTQAEAEAKSDEPKPKTQSNLPSGVSYGKNGFEFKTDDGKFALAIQNRIQARYANPFDSDRRLE